jgi:hypothetical protein
LLIPLIGVPDCSILARLAGIGRSAFPSLQNEPAKAAFASVDLLLSSAALTALPHHFIFLALPGPHPVRFSARYAVASGSLFRLLIAIEPSTTKGKASPAIAFALQLFAGGELPHLQ